MSRVPDILIVGASARAAAWSAQRAGLLPIAIDQFGDEDLRAVCETVRVSTSFPHDLPEHAATLPDCPWLYTGALENHPRIVRAITSRRPLWGNDADVLRNVRDPFRVAAVLAEARLPYLEGREPQHPGCSEAAGVLADTPGDGAWILRPRRSAAGRGIRRWTGASTDVVRPGDLLQRFAPGESFSAVVIARTKGAEVVGLTRQLFDADRPFEWRGNVGPVRLPDAVEREVEAIAIRLVAVFGLRGVVGIDFVVDLAADLSRPFVTEVNPRYTAAVEVLELALGRAVLADLEGPGQPGCDASRSERSLHWGRTAWSSGDGVVAKRVVFATRDLVFEGVDVEPDAPDPRHVASIADRPAAGTPISAGQPICTLLVKGETAEACLLALAARGAGASR